MNSPTTGDVSRDFGFALTNGESAMGDPSDDAVDRFWLMERKSRVGATGERLVSASFPAIDAHVGIFYPCPFSL